MLVMLTCMDIDLKFPGAAAAAAAAGSLFGVAAADSEREFRLPSSLMSALGASPSTFVGLPGPPTPPRTAELDRAKLRRGNL